jgi:hypothetical protein
MNARFNQRLGCCRGISFCRQTADSSRDITARRNDNFAQIFLLPVLPSWAYFQRPLGE